MNQYNSRFPLHRPPPPPQFLQNGDPQSFSSRPQMWFPPRHRFQNAFPARGQCPQAHFSMMNNNSMSNMMQSPPGNNCGFQGDVFGYNLNSRPNHTDFKMQQPNLPSNNNMWQNGRPNSNRPNHYVDGGKFNPKHNSTNRNQWQNKNKCRNNGNNNNNNNNQANTQKKKKNKPKVDKRELAENNNFFCDTCDRGYKDEDKYQEHVKSHVKCTFGECSYIAHPKLVRLHVNLQHKTGLAKKIWQLESQEDVDKWRNERKRNYPTEENVKKKMLIKAEREARGEVIETKQFGKMQKRGKRDRFSKQKEGKEVYQARKRMLQESSEDGQGLDENGSCSAKKIQKNDSKPHSVMEENKQNNGDPLSVLANRSGSEAEKDENKSVSLTGGLGTLMASYSDSDNSDDNYTETQNNSKNGQNTSLHRVEKDNDKEDNVENTKRNRKRQRGRKNKKMENGPIKLRKSTLLEKLLAPDIRHERNVILQCVHYIVKNDFFRTAADVKTLKKSETMLDVEVSEH